MASWTSFFLWTQNTYSVTYTEFMKFNCHYPQKSDEDFTSLASQKLCWGILFVLFISVYLRLPCGPWPLVPVRDRVSDRRFCRAGLPGVCPCGAGAGLSGCFVFQCTELLFSFFSLLTSFYWKTLSISVCIEALVYLNCPFKGNSGT